MRIKFLMCLLLASHGVIGQKATFSEVTVTNRLRIGNAWVKSVQLDSSDWGIDKLPKADIVKMWVESRIAKSKDSFLLGYMLKLDTIGGEKRLNVDSAKLAERIIALGGGGGGSNIYNSDGALTDNRFINLNSKTLQIYNGINANYQFNGTGLTLTRSSGSGSHNHSIILDQNGTTISTSSTGTPTDAQFQVTNSSILGHAWNSTKNSYFNIFPSTIEIKPQDSLTITTGISVVADTNTNKPLVITGSGKVSKGYWPTGGSIINAVYNERFASSTSTTLTLAHNYITATLRVFKNGVRLDAATDFTETTANTITINVTRLSTDIILIDYNY